MCATELLRIVGTTALRGLNIAHSFQQPHIVLLAPHQGGAKTEIFINQVT